MMGMKVVLPVVYLLLACFIGLIFMSWGIYRGDTVQISPILIYGFVVVYAFPLWLFAFLPLFICVAPKSLLWRWYVAPPLGAVLGFVAGLIAFGAHFDTSDNVGVRISITPTIIGFLLFLFGTVSKIRSNDESLSS